MDGVKKPVTEAKFHPVLTSDAAGNTLTLVLRTADLWTLVNAREIEAQVLADKGTLCKALNYFSRRLDELEYQFRKVGLEVTVTHKETGSWTTLVRRDEVFLPDPTVLVRADGSTPSASGTSSGGNLLPAKGVQPTEDNQIAVDPPVTAPAA